MIPVISLPPPVPAPVVQSVANVPFYSQFADISSAKWQKVGCGIASIAMVIDYYSADPISVDTILSRGIASGAYDTNAGWSHQGLINLTKKYGLNGTTYDLSNLSSKAALAKLQTELKNGPVIVSVHYKFEPKNPIPHLVVIDGIRDGVVYYNDPAAKSGKKQISSSAFAKAWKQRFIVIRPASKVAVAREPMVGEHQSLAVFLGSWLGRFPSNRVV